jgi:hypothetical protein
MLEITVICIIDDVMQLTVLDAHGRARCEDGQDTGIQLQQERHVALHRRPEVALYNRRWRGHAPLPGVSRPRTHGRKQACEVT